LFYARIAAAAQHCGTECWLRVHVVLHHADTVGDLVIVKLVHLGLGESTVPAFSLAVVIGNPGDNDDATKVAARCRVQHWQFDASLRDKQCLKWNTIAVQARCGLSGRVCIARDDENGGLDNG